MIHPPPAAPSPPGGPSAPADLYRLLVERAEVGLFVTQHERFRYVNPRLLRMFGREAAEMLAMDPLRMALPEDRPRIADPARDGACDIRCQRKDGSVFNARVWSCPIELDGAPARMTSMHDVSEIKQAALAAEHGALLLAETEALALIGSSEYDVATGAVHQSAGMFRVFGEPVAGGRVDGEWLMDRVPASEAAFVRAVLEGVRPDVPCEFEHRIRHTDGSPRTVLHRATAQVDARGHVIRVINLVQDITAQRQAEQQRDLLAHSDTVTRLPNRSALLDHLDSAARHAQREGRRIGLLALKIDQLSAVSESFGYAAGDRLLAAAAERLSATMDMHHLLAHLGSGSYAVLLNERSSLDEDGALQAADRLLAAFDAPFTIEGTEIVIHGAVGLALTGRAAAGASSLLDQAKAALGRAIDMPGTRRVCVYSAEAHAATARRLALESALRQALERGGFELMYQPQMDLRSGAMVGVEALLRWSDPTLGSVSPAEFIPIAEESDLILPLGDWVLRSACAQALAWQRDGLPAVRVAVNLSVRQLEQPDLAARIEAVLRDTGLAPGLLGVEITESMMVVDAALVARTLRQLKTLGIEISLDDFGTGYSNLGHLRTLPIDVVKIDRSLVHDVTAAPHDVSLTRAVITMARALNMKVLAEGVETEGQLALLIANGCDQMQGYYFSRPVHAATLAAMLREGRGLPTRLL